MALVHITESKIMKWVALLYEQMNRFTEKQ